MEETCLAMGFSPLHVQTAVAALGADANVEAVVTWLLANPPPAAQEEEQTTSVGGAAANDGASSGDTWTRWQEVPPLNEIEQILLSAKTDGEIAISAAQSLCENVSDFCLTSGLQIDLVLKAFVDISQSAAKKTISNLYDEISEPGVTPSQVLSITSRHLKLYRAKTFFLVSSLGAVVSLLDDRKVTELTKDSLESIKKFGLPLLNAIPDEIAPSFDSDWEKLLATELSARLVDSHLLLEKPAAAAATPPLSSPLPPPVIASLVPLLCYRKKTQGVTIFLFTTTASDLARNDRSMKDWTGGEVVGGVFDREMAGSLPLYRLWKAGAKEECFFTTSQVVASSMETTQGYSNDGIICYVPEEDSPYPTTAVLTYEVKTKGKKKGAESFVFSLIKHLSGEGGASAPAAAPVAAAASASRGGGGSKKKGNVNKAAVAAAPSGTMYVGAAFHIVEMPSFEDYVKCRHPVWSRVADAAGHEMIASAQRLVEKGREKIADNATPVAAGHVDDDLILACRGVQCGASITTEVFFPPKVVRVLNPCSVCGKELEDLERYCTEGCISGRDGALEDWKCSVCENVQCCSGLHACCRCCAQCQGNPSRASKKAPVVVSTRLADGSVLLSRSLRQCQEAFLLRLKEVAASWTTESRPEEVLLMCEHVVEVSHRVCDALSTVLGKEFSEPVMELLRSSLSTTPFEQLILEVLGGAAAATEDSSSSIIHLEPDLDSPLVLKNLDLLARGSCMVQKAGDAEAKLVAKAFGNVLQPWIVRCVTPLLSKKINSAEEKKESGSQTDQSLETVIALAACIARAVCVAEKLSQHQMGVSALARPLWSQIYQSFGGFVESLDGLVEEWVNIAINLTLDQHAATLPHSAALISSLTPATLATLAAMLPRKSQFATGFRSRLVARIARQRSKGLDVEAEMVENLKILAGMDVRTESAILDAARQTEDLNKRFRKALGASDAPKETEISFTLYRKHQISDVSLFAAANLVFANPLPTSALQSVLPRSIFDNCSAFAAFIFNEIDCDKKHRNETSRPPSPLVLWQLALGSAQVAIGNSPVSAIVSTAAMCVLLQFNAAMDERKSEGDNCVLSYETLRLMCGLSEPLLQSALLSLSAPRHPLLVVASGDEASQNNEHHHLFSSSTTFRPNFEGIKTQFASSTSPLIVRSVKVHVPADPPLVKFRPLPPGSGAARMLRILRSRGTSQEIEERELVALACESLRQQCVLDEADMEEELASILSQNFVQRRPNGRIRLVALEDNDTTSQLSRTVSMEGGEVQSNANDKIVPFALGLLDYSATSSSSGLSRVYSDVSSLSLSSAAVLSKLSMPTTAPTRSDSGPSVPVNSSSSSSSSSSPTPSSSSSSFSTGFKRLIASLLSPASPTATSSSAVPPSSAPSSTMTRLPSLGMSPAVFYLQDREAVIESVLNLIAEAEAEFGLHLDTASWGVICHAMKWDWRKLRERCALVGRQKLMQELGVFKKENKSSDEDDSSSKECPVCFCEYEEEKKTSEENGTVTVSSDRVELSCGHCVCRDCFSQFIRTAASDPVLLPLSLRCPGGNRCPRIVSSEIVERSCKEETVRIYREALHSQLLSSWMASSSTTLVTCVCGRYLRCPKANLVVSCECGKIFCVGCKRLNVPDCAESHAPASCDAMQHFRHLETMGPERFNLMRMKNCPGCNHAVNKCGCPPNNITCEGLDKCPQAACDHITCTLCSHEWCWICRGPWRNHQSQWHESPVDEKEQFIAATEAFKKSETVQKEFEKIYSTLDEMHDGQEKQAAVSLARQCERSARKLKYAYVAVYNERSRKLKELLYSRLRELSGLVEEARSKLKDKARLLEKAKASAEENEEKAAEDIAIFVRLSSAIEKLTTAVSVERPCDWLVRHDAAVADDTRQETAKIAAEERTRRLAEVAQRRTDMESRREEIAQLYRSTPMRVGSVVRRGLDWEWDTQDHDANGVEVEGVVTEVRSASGLRCWVRVRWMGGTDENTYRWGEGDRFDLTLVRQGDGTLPPIGEGAGERRREEEDSDGEEEEEEEEE